MGYSDHYAGEIASFSDATGIPYGTVLRWAAEMGVGKVPYGNVTIFKPTDEDLQRLWDRYMARYIRRRVLAQLVAQGVAYDAARKRVQRHPELLWEEEERVAAEILRQQP